MRPEEWIQRATDAYERYVIARVVELREGAYNTIIESFKRSLLLRALLSFVVMIILLLVVLFFLCFGSLFGVIVAVVPPIVALVAGLVFYRSLS
ncbi:hypothetical protein BDW67DRAFT_189227 [Aspergillus spinulosporus]